jgi:Radical SAM superfamily/B12 binding domain
MHEEIARTPRRPLRLVLAASRLSSLSARVSEGWNTFDFSIYRLEAAVRADPTLRHVELVRHELPAGPPEELAAALLADAPDIIGLSVYVWSFAALVAIARAVKRRRPEVCVLFGGPSARPAMFDLAPFRDARSALDAVCLGDGEDVLRDVLRLPNRSREALADVVGLAVPAPLGWRGGARRPRLERLDDLASPYQMDLAPTGVAAVLETFRGCPISCRFCEWGVMDSPKSVLSAEYLARELAGIRRARSTVVIDGDAGLNLNSRAFRNLARAEAEVGLFREVPLSCCVYPSHLTDEHVDFLSRCRVARVGLGLQTFNPEALRAMDRPFDPARFDSAIRTLVAHARTVIELIAGLPGDSAESFRASFERARSYGCEVVVSHCLVLPDGLMTRAPDDAAMDFDPFTLEMRSCKGWPPGAIEEVVDWCEHADEAWPRLHGGANDFRKDAPNITGHDGLRAKRAGRPGAKDAAAAIERLLAPTLAPGGTIGVWTLISIDASLDESVVLKFEAQDERLMIVEVRPRTDARPAYRRTTRFNLSYYQEYENHPCAFDQSVIEEVVATIVHQEHLSTVS